MLKRICAVVLALAMILSMSVVAFGDWKIGEPPPPIILSICLDCNCDDA